MRRLIDRLSAARRNDGGFTLIELLIVIVILGVLAAIVVFSVRGITDKGDKAACKANFKTALTGIEAFYANSNPNAYPADMGALVTGGFLAENPATSGDAKTNVTYALTGGNYTLTGGTSCATLTATSS